MKDFKTRRESILAVFHKAKSDLEALNADIQAEIDANKQQIAAPTTLNSELMALKSNNEVSVAAFKKFFK